MTISSVNYRNWLFGHPGQPHIIKPSFLYIFVGPELANALGFGRKSVVWPLFQEGLYYRFCLFRFALQIELRAALAYLTGINA